MINQDYISIFVFTLSWICLHSTKTLRSLTYKERLIPILNHWDFITIAWVVSYPLVLVNDCGSEEQDRKRPIMPPKCRCYMHQGAQDINHHWSQCKRRDCDCRICYVLNEEKTDKQQKRVAAKNRPQTEELQEEEASSPPTDALSFALLTVNQSLKANNRRRREADGFRNKMHEETKTEDADLRKAREWLLLGAANKSIGRESLCINADRKASPT